MDIRRPTLLVNESICRSNIQNMVDKARTSGAELRPHFKTHHSAEIGSWFSDFGVKKCTVSSVSMAEYFANNGWDDITIAFPCNTRESEGIDALANQIDLNILVESWESFDYIKKNVSSTLSYYIEIDVGSQRTGIDHKDKQLIQKLVSASTKELKFKGFLANAGHTYGAKDRNGIERIFDEAQKMLDPLRKEFGGMLSFGDTPSCSLMEDLSAYDELRPGNFVFYDWMQKQLGACEVEHIAVCLAAPVVAIHRSRKEVVIHGGAVHLSKDFLLDEDQNSYGKAVLLEGNTWNTNVIGNVSRLSQEHGVVGLKDEYLSEIKIGDLIGIIPIHSCLAADLQGYYLSTEGKKINKVIKE